MDAEPALLRNLSEPELASALDSNRPRTRDALLTAKQAPGKNTTQPVHLGVLRPGRLHLVFRQQGGNEHLVLNLLALPRPPLPEATIGLQPVTVQPDTTG